MDISVILNTVGQKNLQDMTSEDGPLIAMYYVREAEQEGGTTPGLSRHIHWFSMVSGTQKLSDSI
jgi:hypothetical protein